MIGPNSPLRETLRRSAVARALRNKSPKSYDWLRWQLTKWSYESIYFITMHKCASSLFGGYVLRHLQGRKQRYIDVYRRYRATNVPTKFEKYGCVYGPIRTWLSSPGPFDRLLDEHFIRDKLVMFLIRDPRDILVSQYYSFGFSHPFNSTDPERLAEQETWRKKIQSKTVDEYVLDESDALLRRYSQLMELETACARSTTLQYEDMIGNFDAFLNQFTKVAPLQPGVAEKIYLSTRPRPREDIHSHRRSGKIGGFRDKLEPATIDALNEKFSKILGHYRYEI